MQKTEGQPLPRLILPNLGRRFSGVTSTMLQTLPHQMKAIPLVIWGSAFVEGDLPVVRFRELLRITQESLEDGSMRVYHARRNIEMLWGLVLKKLFRRELKLVFTSTAQRKHSGYTRFLYHRMDAIITTSDRAGSFLDRPADYIIPHGIDIEAYPTVEDKRKSWEQLALPGTRGIGIFGRVRPQKGVDLFVEAMIEALPRHQEFTAVIVGKTTPKHEPFVQSLKRRIEKAGLSERFVWLGEVEFSELPSLYGAMSIVASVSRVEGFGLTCLEAMSSGAPVIASRTGGFELVVRDGKDGYLVDCGSANDIRDRFLEMAKDPDQLEAMGRSARERIESAFTIQREADDLVKAYNEISRRP
jgi:mannosyltransferase